MRSAFGHFLPVALAFGSGVAVGLLLAPQPGQQTRRRLAVGARETAGAARERAQGVVAPVADRARQAAAGFADRHVPLAGDWDVVDGTELRRGLPGMPPR